MFCLQRSHGFSAMDTLATATLNAYGKDLQRSHGLLATDIGHSIGITLEMILLQRSHGPSAMDTPSRLRSAPPATIGFNGATAFQPWTRLGGSRTHNNGVFLQRGHDLSAMDIRPHRCLRRHRHLASMEPRLFSHGYNACRMAVAASLV